MLSPTSAHRFVGALEQEAVLTYTGAIKDLESGRLPEWCVGSLFCPFGELIVCHARENLAAPNLALDYWRLKHDAKVSLPRTAISDVNAH